MKLTDRYRVILNIMILFKYNLVKNLIINKIFNESFTFSEVQNLLPEKKKI